MRRKLLPAVLAALAKAGAARSCATLTLVAALAGVPWTLRAQTPGGSIRGAVLDVDTRVPLAGALLTLQPEPPGLLPSNTAGGAALTTARTFMTDSAGAFAFAGLVPGRYRLDATRPGYDAYSVVVELRGEVAAGVSLGLTMKPIPLRAIRLDVDGRDPFPRRALTDSTHASRPAPPSFAGRKPLVTDAVEVTGEDVVEAVTAGAPDLFRAIQRLPSFGTRSDYTAELWTRGAPWHQTRVFFDGVPLFDPLHGLGTVSGIGAEAVGALWAYPGVHPASLPEGAAGAVELKTRRGEGDGALGGSADLSIVSADLTLDQRTADGRADWLLSGRRTSLDWLTKALARSSGRPDLRLPYTFWDLTGRADFRLSDAQSIEVSGLHQHDGWTHADGDAGPTGSADWGSDVARVTLVSRVGDVEARHTAGYSSRSGHVRVPAAATFADAGWAPTPDAAPATSTDVSLVTFQGEWRRATASGTGWATGYGLTGQASSYDGSEAWPYVPVPSTAPTPIVTQVYKTVRIPQTQLWTGGAWADATVALGPRLLLQGALRVDAGDQVTGSGTVHPAPRLSARWQLAPRFALSAGAGRTWQYAQSLAPSGLRKASLSSDHIWLLAGAAVPALRADVATAGAEAWVAGTWLVNANAYVRHTEGMALPDPTPGLVTAPRPLFVLGTGDARGLELSARRVAPRWSFSAGYALARSEAAAAGLRFPAAADRRHSLDATGSVRVTRPLRVGAAFSAASALPYTRVDQVQVGSSLVPRVGEPDAERGRPYASLDLLLDWSGRIAGQEAGAFFQLRNATAHDNTTAYIDARPGCVLSYCGDRAIMENRYEQGLPRLPVFGVRVRF